MVASERARWPSPASTASRMPRTRASTSALAVPVVAASQPSTCVNDATLPLRPDSYCARDNYSLFQLQRDFFVHAMASPDQLRQRVAFALSQVLVTSGTEISIAYGGTGQTTLQGGRVS